MKPPNFVIGEPNVNVMLRTGIIFIIAILSLSQLSLAQQIPQAAKDSFHKKYPDAREVSWSVLERNNGFQVNFMDGKNHRHATFSLNSDWVSTRTVISSKRELPTLVRSVIDENYPDCAYDWMEWFESGDGNYYIVGITSSGEEKEKLTLSVTKDGKIIDSSVENKSHHQR